MHEAFHKDDATQFTRKWFAWANTLFGELVWKVYRERKQLLD
jgi:meiotically up-regulated gene 157 (Mug157) protein